MSTSPVAVPTSGLHLGDDLADEWWRPGGALSMLHWIARARAALVPPARRDGAVLVDLGCGGGVLAPHLAGKGYLHVGVDVVTSSLVQAATHGVRVVRGDVTALPLPDRCADVVSAGELFEHVPDLAAAVREACRVLRPGGLLVADTLNATWVARLAAVTVGERIPGVAPRGVHDPALFVPPRRLRAECARHGVDLRVRGIRPAAGALLRWLVTRRGEVPIVPSRSTAVLYQAWGVRRPTGGDDE
ncbi:MAG TPA: methyltransferase domain-containing protein [Natronosporangium sp.]|nr:methyltransferase domain-containing protein [Natronosporangium sp.]